MGKDISTQDLVQMFCQDDRVKDNLVYIIEIDDFCYYKELHGYYKLLNRRDLKNMIYDFLFVHLNKSMSDSLLEDFIKQMKLRCIRTVDDLSSDWVSLSGQKLLNLKTFELADINKEDKAYYYLKCEPTLFVEANGVAPPRFQRFLDEILTYKTLEPDYTLQTVVQEMMGYYLLDTLEAHATFFLVGGGRNGKSVLLNILREMVGKEFSEAISIEKLTTSEFAMSALIGKKINICMEEESSYIKSDKFKAMISGDPVSVRRLYQQPFTWKPTVKHVFATNESPSFTGLNFGLIRRIFIIPFNRTILDAKVDTQLTSKLLSEMPGIMSWAIAGAKRLVANDFRFSPCEQMDNKMKEFKENISAAIMFFNERYSVTEGAASFVPNDDVYEEYKAWVEMRGKKKQSYYVFIKDIETLTGLKDIEGKNSENQLCVGKCIKRK
jgi:putative DNA primase/helicase